VSGADLDRRLLALAEAAELARGRVDGAAADAAQAVVDRAGVRLGLGLETTVVALAGPTGAGKSSLFNAVAGEELVTAGVRRPTTSSVTAAVWGRVKPELLDWLAAARRHVVDDGVDEAAGVVLLDLPDYDSVEAAHRLEMERVIELVDLLVWVTDPQKYADAALHDRYLSRLSGHGEAMLVVLNQSDRLDDRGVEACRVDLRRLLAEDGLPGLPVLPVSALTGDGVGELRDEVRRRVDRRTAAAARLTADVRAVAAPLAAGCEGRAKGVPGRARRELVDALSVAAGVPTVVSAVAATHQRNGRLATGWPYARWIARLRPDPLRRLRILARPDDRTRTSIPRASAVQSAQVASAARTLAAESADGLPEPWPGLVRQAAGAREDVVPDRLDRAVAGTELQPRPPRWWGAASAGQVALALVAGAGALWLLALAVLGYLQLDDVIPTPHVGDIAVPTLLLLAGVAAGLVLGFVARILNRAGGARRARGAARKLEDAIAEVAQELVVTPVEAELDARERLCAAAARARQGR
jgi:GTP-binding protein EngB required for normal cell division